MTYVACFELLGPYGLISDEVGILSALHQLFCRGLKCILQ